MSTSPATSLVTAGYLVVMFQQSHAVIRKALAAAGVAPVELRNGVEHFAEAEAAKAIRQYLAREGK